MADGAIELIKERTDIVDLVGARVPLRQAGRSFKGLCPFHQEKTPSFVVYPDGQTFHCFGCGKSGDIFTFVMLTENLDFRDTLRQLAERAGVELQQTSKPRDDAADQHKQRLIDLNERAAGYYANVLWNTQAGEPARALLERRGIDRKTAEQFSLGFAPPAWEALRQFLTSRGEDDETLQAAGLLSSNERGSVYDRFRNRLMFPIRDRDGRALGFGARALGDEKPKYLNSPETAIFDKRSILYALDRGWEEIRRRRSLVVVEGYMDAITAHQHGFTDVVASMGTAVTPEQVSGIRRYVDRLFLALDADAAGQLAALRGVEALREGFADEERAVIMPHGPVRFERTLGAEIRVVVLPHGKDPDELIRSDVAAWPRALENAVPLVEYVLTRSLENVENSPAARAKALQEVAAPLLREIPDPAVQAHYVALTARLLGYRDTDVSAALLRRTTVGSMDTRAVVRGVRPSERPRGSDPERYLIALMLRYPQVALSYLPQLNPDDLLDSRHREVVQAIVGSDGTVESVRQQLPPELSEFADRLASELADRPGMTPGASNREIGQALQRLGKERYNFRVTQLQTELDSAKRAGDFETVSDLMQRLAVLVTRKGEFDPRESTYFRDTRTVVT